MDSSLVQTILTTGGTGIAVAFILVVAGILVPKYSYERVVRDCDRKDMVIEKLQDALERERQGHNEATSAASTSNSLIEALVSVARGGEPHGGDTSGGREPRRRAGGSGRRTQDG